MHATNKARGSKSCNKFREDTKVRLIARSFKGFPKSTVKNQLRRKPPYSARFIGKDLRVTANVDHKIKIISKKKKKKVSVPHLKLKSSSIELCDRLSPRCVNYFVKSGVNSYIFHNDNNGPNSERPSSSKAFPKSSPRPPSAPSSTRPQTHRGIFAAKVILILDWEIMKMFRKFQSLNRPFQLHCYSLSVIKLFREQNLP